MTVVADDCADRARVVLDAMMLTLHADGWGREVRAEVVALRTEALGRWKKAHPRRAKKVSWRGWPARRCGMHRTMARGESDYACILCGESLSTIGHGTISSIPVAMIDRFSAHTLRCGALYLLAGDEREFSTLVRSDLGRPPRAFAPDPDYTDELDTI